MSRYPAKDILVELGFPDQDIVVFDGEWPSTIVTMRENTGKLDRGFVGFFDIFIPTRTVTLHELTGGYKRKKYNYRYGMAGFNPPEAEWAISWEGVLEGFAIVYETSTIEKASQELFGESYKSLDWRQAICDRAPAIAYLGLDIAGQATTGFPAGKTHVNLQMRAFLAMLIRRYAVTPERNTALVGVSSRQVLRAVQYIEAHLTQPLSLQHISDVSAASIGHLNRLFRVEVGHTVWGYVMLRRINAAAEKLTQSDDTVENIAKQFGFKSRSNFTRQFKTIRGKSPGNFRKEAQRQSQV